MIELDHSEVEGGKLGYRLVEGHLSGRFDCPREVIGRAWGEWGEQAQWIEEIKNKRPSKMADGLVVIFGEGQDYGAHGLKWAMRLEQTGRKWIFRDAASTEKQGYRQGRSWAQWDVRVASTTEKEVLADWVVIQREFLDVQGHNGDAVGAKRLGEKIRAWRGVVESSDLRWLLGDGKWWEASARMQEMLGKIEIEGTGEVEFWEKWREEQNWKQGWRYEQGETHKQYLERVNGRGGASQALEQADWQWNAGWDWQKAVKAALEARGWQTKRQRRVGGDKAWAQAEEQERSGGRAYRKVTLVAVELDLSQKGKIGYRLQEGKAGGDDCPCELAEDKDYASEQLASMGEAERAWRKRCRRIGKAEVETGDHVVVGSDGEVGRVYRVDFTNAKEKQWGRLLSGEHSRPDELGTGTVAQAREWLNDAEWWWANEGEIEVMEERWLETEFARRSEEDGGLLKEATGCTTNGDRWKAGRLLEEIAAWQDWMEAHEVEGKRKGLLEEAQERAERAVKQSEEVMAGRGAQSRERMVAEEKERVDADLEGLGGMGAKEAADKLIWAMEREVQPSLEKVLIAWPSVRLRLEMQVEHGLIAQEEAAVRLEQLQGLLREAIGMEAPSVS